MKVGFYAGSFDPFTNGHLHVVKRSAKLFDKVIIGIGVNSSKNRRYHQDIIKEAIEKVLKREGLENVFVILYSDLSIAVAKEHDTTFFIRGIRNGMDYDYEEMNGSNSGNGLTYASSALDRFGINDEITDANFKNDQDLKICIETGSAQIYDNHKRMIKILHNGSGQSAIRLVDADDEADQCQD